jgi:hypothetical protein
MSLEVSMPMYLASKPNEPSIRYGHYRIAVSRVGKGWRASIYAPNATHPLADSPSNLEKSEQNEILTEARRIIDAHLASTRRVAAQRGSLARPLTNDTNHTGNARWPRGSN